jgi:hypothetical protein
MHQARRGRPPLSEVARCGSSGLTQPARSTDRAAIAAFGGLSGASRLASEFARAAGVLQRAFCSDQAAWRRGREI